MESYAINDAHLHVFLKAGVNGIFVEKLYA